MNGSGGTLGGLAIAPGDVLLNKYRVERLIGEGGTGVVLLATHVQQERHVAIKLLRRALVSDELRTRFKREARAMGTLASEHVALVLEAGALDDGAPYMVMEYLDGRDLARVLKEDGPLPVEQAVDCVLQVCEALDQAHSAGIVHRDLKPANLFLTRREKDGSVHVKVVDFGISKILGKKLAEADENPNDVTSARTMLGSPRYMAPEQVNSSRDVDARADLWSVGAVLFQLVTGQHAFAADGNVEATLAVLTSPPQSLCALAPHAPSGLEAVVNRCLTKDVTKRFQTASELAEALRPFASDRAKTSLDRIQSAKAYAGSPSLHDSASISTSRAMPAAQASAALSRDAPTERKLRVSRVPSAPVSSATHVAAVVAPQSSTNGAPTYAVALGIGAVVVVALGGMAIEHVTPRHLPNGAQQRSSVPASLHSATPVLLDAGKANP